MKIELLNEIKEKFTKDGSTEIIIVFNKKDLASPSEIEYLKDNLNLIEDEIFFTNALTGENLDKISSYLEKRYF